MMLLLLAASVAPTDAGLGAATVLNPVVPVRVRRMLNVESGLNDGLCTPFVLFAIAALAGEEGLAARREHRRRARRPGGGHRRRSGRRRRGGAAARLVARARLQLAAHPARSRVLVLPLIAYFGAELAGGNAFVAAFVAGTAFAGTARWLDDEESSLGLTEAAGRPARVRGLARLRLHRRARAGRARRLARGRLRGARPDPAADGSGGPGAARHRPAGRRPSPSSAGSGRAGWRRWSSPCWRPRGSSSTRT